jgi:hypothetical protein
MMLALGAPDDWMIQNDYVGPTIRLGDGREVNALAHYWSDVVGLPFDRDALVEIPETPLDLDLDRKVDVVFSGKWSLPGGILKNADQIGLTPTPDDPAGRVGKYSISTGFLGVRQELDQATHRGTGRYAVNCWHCHGSADEHGQIVLGRPNQNIYLGLMMASSRVMDPDWIIRERSDGPPTSPDELRRSQHVDESFHLDANGDGRVSIAEWRTALRMPPANVARAMLMLAGPGRLDQSIDFRMDGLIPLAHLQDFDLLREGRAAYLRAESRPKLSVFNPVSLPQNLSGLGVAHYSWSGKDSSMRFDAEKAACDAMHNSPEDIADLIGFPHTAHVDHERLCRALTLDFRNMGTFGTESDSLDAMRWSHMVLTKADKSVLHDAPEKFGIVSLRNALLGRGDRSETVSRDSLIEKGREIFTDRITGKIINQRVLLGREAMRPKGYEGIPVLAPIDRSQPITAIVSVRCASCHNYSPLSNLQPLKGPLEPLQRCDQCHFDHPTLKTDNERSPGFLSLKAHMERHNLASVEQCLRCHHEHPDFGPQAFSNSWLLPFDANGNGLTNGDEATDVAAQGIGTDAMLNLESLFVTQLYSPQRRPKKTFLITDNARTLPSNPRFSSQGPGWIRVAPLILIGQSAPYLHNGSVPTLDALLSPPDKRPATFPVGLPGQHFTFDTSIPGNRNGGHAFGIDLAPEDKTALIAYLKSLP